MKGQRRKPVEADVAAARRQVLELEEAAKGEGEFVAIAPDRFLAWAQRAVGQEWGPEFPEPGTPDTIFYEIAYGVDVRRFLAPSLAEALDAGVGTRPWAVEELEAAVRERGGDAAALAALGGGEIDAAGADKEALCVELDRLEARGVVGRLADVQGGPDVRRPLLHRLFIAAKGAVHAPESPAWEKPWDGRNDPWREGGKKRLVADLRAYNACTVPGDPFAYETADDILTALADGDALLLSKTDIISGYHCVRTDPVCAHLLAFVHPRDGAIYTWRRWPFGIRQGPAVFSLVTAVVADTFQLACAASGIEGAQRPFGYVDDLLLTDDAAGSWITRLRSYLAYLSLPTAANKTEEARARLVHLGWEWQCTPTEVTVRPSPAALLKAARAVATLAQQVVLRGLAPAWLVEHARGICLWVATVRAPARSRIRGFGRALKCPRAGGLVATDAKRVATDLTYWSRELGLGELRHAATRTAALADAPLAALTATAAATWTRSVPRGGSGPVRWKTASDGGDHGYALSAWRPSDPSAVTRVTGAVTAVDAALADAGGEEAAKDGELSSTVREILPLLAWVSSSSPPRGAVIDWATDSQAAAYAVAAGSSRGVFIDTLLARLFDRLEELKSRVLPTWRQRELNAGQDVCADDPDLARGAIHFGADFVRSAVSLFPVPSTRPTPRSPPSRRSA